jgi:hypothetical protein
LSIILIRYIGSPLEDLAGKTNKSFVETFISCSSKQSKACYSNIDKAQPLMRLLDCVIRFIEDLQQIFARLDLFNMFIFLMAFMCSLRSGLFLFIKKKKRASPDRAGKPCANRFLHLSILVCCLSHQLERTKEPPLRRIAFKVFAKAWSFVTATAKAGIGVNVGFINLRAKSSNKYHLTNI